MVKSDSDLKTNSPLLLFKGSLFQNILPMNFKAIKLRKSNYELHY